MVNQKLSRDRSITSEDMSGLHDFTFSDRIDLSLTLRHPVKCHHTLPLLDCQAVEAAWAQNLSRNLTLTDQNCHLPPSKRIRHMLLIHQVHRLCYTLSTIWPLQFKHLSSAASDLHYQPDLPEANIKGTGHYSAAAPQEVALHVPPLKLALLRLGLDAQIHISTSTSGRRCIGTSMVPSTVPAVACKGNHASDFCY